MRFVLAHQAQVTYRIDFGEGGCFGMGQKKLRAYLYSHHPGSVLRCNSFDDYDELASALGILVSNPERRFALDISFQQIESEDALQAFLSSSQSRILISRSAASVLAGQVEVNTAVSETIGSTEFCSLISGWGYRDSKALTAARMPHRAENPAPRGWVAQLKKQDDKLASCAENAGIWDDDSYIECEGKLSPEDRQRLAQARYYLMCGDRPKAASILDNLRCCPPWVTEAKLAGLPLTVRQLNVVNANALKRVADLNALGSKGLLKLPNLGSKSVRELGQVICDTFLAGPRGKYGGVSAVSPKPQAAAAAGSFCELVSTCVGDERPDEKAVWLHRCGVLGKRSTLREVAITLGLSTERIRQIESKVFEKVGTHEVWRILRDHLGQLLQDRPGPLFLKDLSMEDAWFDDGPGLAPTVLFAVDTYCEGLFFAFEVQGETVISRITEKGWRRTIADAKQILGDGSPDQLFEQRARRLTSALLADVGSELREPLLASLGLGDRLDQPRMQVIRVAGSRVPKGNSDEDLNNKLQHELLRRALLKQV